MSKQHLIMHTHWDREWYFTKEETKVLLKNHMLDLFDYLESKPEAIYILDGQTVMIDDFLELAPEYKETLEKYIASGQIRVGPWYTQTDLMLVRGESIVRNLYYGLKKAREYTNTPMLVGYSPDTFGHNAQMPQIYKGFDIGSTYFWRGVSKQKSEDANFEWKALDDSVIFAHSLSSGYQGAKYLENDIETLNERIDEITARYNRYNEFENILIMNGHDQMPVQRNIDEVIEKFNEDNKDSNQEMRITDFEKYEKSVREETKLRRISGELYDPEFTRVHKTISSSRMDIKLLNIYVEDRLFSVLEPLSVIADNMNLPYPHALIEKVLKLLFGAHAHDSIGGCNTDAVNESIKERLINAKDLVDHQIELTLRLINIVYTKKGYDSIIINLFPYSRKNVKTEIDLQTKYENIVLFDQQGKSLNTQVVSQVLRDMADIDRQILARRLDIKRYETRMAVEIDKMAPLSIKAIKAAESDDESEVNEETENFIENEFYKVSFDETLDVLIKDSKERLVNFISVENNGDGGDGYDYSPLHDDWTLGEDHFHLKKINRVSKGHLVEQAELIFEIKLPKDEEERVGREISTVQEYQVNLSLKKNEKEIGIQITTKNKIKDQRTRLKVKSLEDADKVISDTQFGNQERPAVNPNLAIWEEENWVEKPVSIEHFESYVSVQNKNLVYARGLKEYEFKDSAFFITMYRSFAFMGRSDLINRPGRASGMAVPTPKNQLLKVNFEFDFWVNYVGEENPDKRAKELLTPLATYQAKEYNRFNINAFKQAEEFDLEINLDLSGLVVSAVKLTEKDDLLIRVYNPTKEAIVLSLSNDWIESNLNEDYGEAMEEMSIAPYEISTIIKR